MEETNTQIAWPSKLKIGAKSKKGKVLIVGLRSFESIFLGWPKSPVAVVIIWHLIL